MTLNTSALEHGFTLLKSEELPEIDGSAHLLRHEKSGAKLVYLQNEDDNKAFSISFKTPPANHTGVFHILEHSVLCGSERFPVKEPFVNLLKNSMQTFLNAMTFPDKTMYPVASTNEQDLLNLADVYMDAVLNPMIYTKPEILQQEGWHYEVEDGPEPRIVCNGVVFNEMKGALSDPDSVVYNELSAALFPDTAYAFESGGKPEDIPSLSYEEFLDTHARHYRLDNSYITLYGNMDIDRFLGFLDERYLTPCATLHSEAGAPNELLVQEPVISKDLTFEMETTPDNTTMAFGFVAGTVQERKKLVALDVLIDALMGSNEAPLKRALLDFNLADEVQGYLADTMLQPFVIIQFKGIKEGAHERLRKALESAIRTIVDEGIDRELIEASLSHDEFILRERNFGAADGVAFSMSAMSGWLYDDDLAWSYIRFQDVFAELRAELEGTFFENLLEEALLNCKHQADVRLIPVEKAKESPLDAKLAELSATTDAAGYDTLRSNVEALRRAQELPDLPENLAKLPRLSVQDIDDPADEPGYGLVDGQPCRCLHHQASTHGILYAYNYFDMSALPFEELPYATLLTFFLGKLPTKQHTAAQLDTIIQSKLGNLSFFVDVVENRDKRDEPVVNFVTSSSALAGKLEHLVAIPREVLTETQFDDYDKMKNILVQKRIQIEQSIIGNGHSRALSRAASYFMKAGVVQEHLEGVDFYYFLRDLIDTFDERIAEVATHLERLAKTLFHDGLRTLSFTGSQEELHAYWKNGAALPAPNGFKYERVMAIPQPEAKNEAFITPSNVTFAGTGYDRRLLAPESKYLGTWAVATRALSFDYLWNEVRVKGGAYGAGFQAKASGAMRFYSYRDPHLDETLERFGKAGEWLSGLDINQEDLDGYIVSTVSGIDAPVKPRELVRKQDIRFFSNTPDGERLAIRQRVIETSKDKLNSLGAMVGDVAKADCRCVFGNKEIIEGSALDWQVIDLLS